VQCHVSILSRVSRGYFEGTYNHSYGDSEGYPSELGFNYDAQAALDHVTSRVDIDKSKIFVFGRSIGGAVAISLAKENQDKVIKSVYVF
jgi:pimeloyl-ACP methyl ester carboxylesterase